MIRDIRHVESTSTSARPRRCAILKRRLGDKSSITEDLPGNPLPRSYRIKLDDPQNADVVKSSLRRTGDERRSAPISPAIQDIKDREDDTEKILSATSTIKILLAGLAGLLVLASVLLVANTIRLSIFARRREVEVMRLVGATNWFIRWPFVIEGLLVGFVGGVVAVALLWVVKVTVVDPWSDRFALIAAPDTIGFALLVVILLARRHRGVGRGLRHHAAPVPARLSGSGRGPARYDGRRAVADGFSPL